MNRFLVAAFAALLVVSAGCRNDRSDTGRMNNDSMKASMDACPHCPGKQTATADGRCPVCKMKVDKASMSSADVCTACPGMQTATADGKCPGCGAMVAKAGSTSSAADVCTKCPGVQTASADGKCPACGAMVAKQ